MKTFKFLSFFLMVFVATTAFAASSVNWKTDYQQAVQQAKSESKPILLYFTGSDWCGWCKKLDKEVFHTSDFANRMGDKMIFVDVDFPMASTQSQQVKSQNEKLKNKYSIKGFPTVVILDQNENVMGQTGYKPGGPQAYANHLSQIIGK